MNDIAIICFKKVIVDFFLILLMEQLLYASSTYIFLKGSATKLHARQIQDVRLELMQEGAQTNPRINVQHWNSADTVSERNVNDQLLMNNLHEIFHLFDELMISIRCSLLWCTDEYATTTSTKKCKK